MANSPDIDSKYQKLATEYSKIRSQATVLKKGLLDEQSRTTDFKEIIKKHEQQMRKHNQEMESLLFRNEQLTKRILVLQQELQTPTNNKKTKNKSEFSYQVDRTVLDEEFQKKILENAHLVSSLADKEFEITDYREKVEWYEKRVISLQAELEKIEKTRALEIEKWREQTTSLKRNKQDLQKIARENSIETINAEQLEKTKYWQEEAERWKTECDHLRSKPESNEKLTQYYESRISDIFDAKQISQSETKTLWAENLALNSRLENSILEHTQLESELENAKEELITTSKNYIGQLDAMTEHLAAQNDKITKQSDEIEVLRHKLMIKK